MGGRGDTQKEWKSCIQECGERKPSAKQNGRAKRKRREGGKERGVEGSGGLPRVLRTWSNICVVYSMEHWPSAAATAGGMATVQ
jgi:hypothetical protein